MLNKIILQGRLTKDLELRHTQSNTAVASGTIAVQRSRKDNNGEYQSDFCSVVLWGKLAEHASTWFHKGDMCIVCGGKSEGKPQKQEESDFISTDEEFDELPF